VRSRNLLRRGVIRPGAHPARPLPDGVRVWQASPCAGEARPPRGGMSIVKERGRLRIQREATESLQGVPVLRPDTSVADSMCIPCQRERFPVKMVSASRCMECTWTFRESFAAFAEYSAATAERSQAPRERSARLPECFAVLPERSPTFAECSAGSPESSSSSRSVDFARGNVPRRSGNTPRARRNVPRPPWNLPRACGAFRGFPEAFRSACRVFRGRHGAFRSVRGTFPRGCGRAPASEIPFRLMNAA
jgi:hypothetical protein